MDAVDRQLRAGVFIQAWIEAQPALQTLRKPLMALFYVIGRSERGKDGIDVHVCPLAGRAPSLMTALEKGPFSMEALQG